MKKQRGVALSGLLIWGVIIAIVALLGIKVAPEVIDYYIRQKENSHHRTPASSFSFAISSSTDPTLTPALRPAIIRTWLQSRSTGSRIT